MKFLFDHNNFNVLDLEKSIAFMKKRWIFMRQAASTGRKGRSPSSTWGTANRSTAWS